MLLTKEGQIFWSIQKYIYVCHKCQYAGLSRDIADDPEFSTFSQGGPNKSKSVSHAAFFIRKKKNVKFYTFPAASYSTLNNFNFCFTFIFKQFQYLSCRRLFFHQNWKQHISGTEILIFNHIQNTSICLFSVSLVYLLCIS